MVQPGRSLRLLQKTLAALGVTRSGGGQHLDRDNPVEPGVVGLVDFAHAPGP